MVSDTVMDAGALRVDVEGSDAFCLIEEIRHRAGLYPHTGIRTSPRRPT